MAPLPYGEKQSDAVDEHVIAAHGFHVRELYRVIGVIRDALKDGDHELALELASAIADDPLPPARPSDLSEKEFEQALFG